MKKETEIALLAEASLRSLDGLQQAEANEFLYAKVMHRMQLNELKEKAVFNRLMLKLSVALMFFICLNGASVYFFEKQQLKTTKANTNTVAAFADEYSLETNAYGF